MKERPILFNGEMVRAILDGKKTQTRRVIKPQPTQIREAEYELDCGKAWLVTYANGTPEDEWIEVCAPYNVGDHLWVRETWQPDFSEHGDVFIHYRADDKWGIYPMTEEIPDEWVEREWTKLDDIYRAASVPQNSGGRWLPESIGFKAPWKPSIFMPKWATRIWLEVTGVRAERVQDISEEDAEAEGVTPILRDGGGFEPWGAPCPPFPCYAEVFARLWDSINAKRGFGWDTNPWVWVYEFKRLETPAGAKQ